MKLQSPYQNVIAALDLESSSDYPIITASRIARECNASFRVVAAARSSLLRGRGFFNAELVDRSTLLTEARKALSERCAEHKIEAPDADLAIGDPAEIIAEAAIQSSCDLIVLGARRRNRLEHLFGTTTTAVLRQASGIDVYACHRPDPDNPIDTAIIAIDGGPATAQVLAKAADFLLTANSNPIANSHIICITTSQADANKAIKRCQQHMDESPWQEWETRLELESVTDTLDDAIKSYDADLIIIGSGENSGLGWAIGSTSNSILHEVSCDVLMIRP